MSTTTDARVGPPSDFAGLCAAAAAGDSLAFEGLIGPLLPGLRGYLRAEEPREAEDLAADVLLAVFRNLGRFEGTPAQFRAWVFTCARHKVLDERRRSRRRRTEPLETAERIASRSDVEAEAMSNASMTELLEVLAAISPAQRQVLLLRIVADLSVEETAAVLAKRAGAVRVLQHRALGAVAKRIRREV